MFVRIKNYNGFNSKKLIPPCRTCGCKDFNGRDHNIITINPFTTFPIRKLGV